MHFECHRQEEARFAAKHNQEGLWLVESSFTKTMGLELSSMPFIKILLISPNLSRTIPIVGSSLKGGRRAGKDAQGLHTSPTGSRICMSKPLALSELMLTMATSLCQFEFRVSDRDKQA
jgi:hypothetical protein